MTKSFSSCSSSNSSSNSSFSSDPKTGCSSSNCPKDDLKRQTMSDDSVDDLESGSDIEEEI